MAYIVNVKNKEEFEQLISMELLVINVKDGDTGE